MVDVAIIPPYVAPQPASLGGKLESSLAYLWDEFQESDFSAIEFLSEAARRPDSNVRSDDAGRVLLTFYSEHIGDDVLTALATQGFQVAEVLVSKGDIPDIIAGWAPFDQLDEITTLDFFRYGWTPGLPQLRTGAVNSAGDGILRSDLVRARFSAMGIDGSGVKVGVISNGVTNRANVQATGDLPASITVDPARPGSGNEGTAMLEILHDLAPGAQLYFSSGSASATSMGAGINWLVSQGVQVIVDDIGWFNEAYFQDSDLAQSAANAIASGVAFVSAAGNESPDHYQADFVQGPASHDGHWHDFGGGNTGQRVSIPVGARFRAILQWSDPFSASSNDYDLFLRKWSDSSILDSGIVQQVGAQNPYEDVDWTNTTGATMDAYVAVDRVTGAANRKLELFTFGDSFQMYNTPGDAIFGHPAVDGVIAVAAVDAADSGNDTVESFSSQGPSTIYTNFTSQTSTQRNSLDGAGIDGVQTKIGQLGGFPNPFFGTSAAAPHVAAIAALMKDANNALTPAQIAANLAATTVDIGAAGYDQVAGNGRFDALSAVYKSFVPAAADMTPATDSGASNSDNITTFLQPTFGGSVPAQSYVRLFVDGVQRNAVQLGAGVTSYSLAPTTNLTAGAHAVTITVAENSTSVQSNPSTALNITIDTTAPKITGVTIENSNGLHSPYSIPGGSGQQLKTVPVGGANRVTITFNEQVTVVSGDMELRGQVAAGGVTTYQYSTFSSVSGGGGAWKAIWTLGGATPKFLATKNALKLLSGAGNVRDLAGNTLDGEWADPPANLADASSTNWPGGNNVAGGNFVFSFTTLPGDGNRTNIVTAADYTIWADHYPTISGGTFITGDYDGDGDVDASDYSLWLANSGVDFSGAGYTF